MGVIFIFGPLFQGWCKRRKISGHMSINCTDTLS
jgi:hypothetical protein